MACEVIDQQLRRRFSLSLCTFSLTPSFSTHLSLSVSSRWFAATSGVMSLQQLRCRLASLAYHVHTHHTRVCHVHSVRLAKVVSEV